MGLDAGLAVGEILRDEPLPLGIESLAKRLRETLCGRAAAVWKYWDEHPYGDGSAPLFDAGILHEPYWLKN